MGHRQALNRTEALRILGLARDCSESEMRQAYHDLVQVWHPDRFAEPRLKQRAEEELKRINEAYAVLISSSPAGAAPPSRTTVGLDREYTARRSASRAPPPLRWLSGVKVFLWAAVAAAPLALAWQVYSVLRPVVPALESVLAGSRPPVGQSKLLYPGLAVNPVADLASASENLQTWALMRWLELRQTRLVAVPAELSSAESLPVKGTSRPHPESPTRPATGELTRPGPPYGVGRLEISNSTTLDAAVQVAALDRARSSPWLVYIRAGESFAIQDLAPQRYVATVELGEGWLAGRAVFKTGRRRVEPIGPLSFIQIQSSRQVFSDVFRVEIKSGGQPSAR